MKRRELGTAIILGGLVLLLAGAMSRAWWTPEESRGVTGGFGLRGVEMCRGGTCESISYSTLADIGRRGEDVKGRTKAFIVVGNMAYWGALVVAALAAVAIGLAFARPAQVAPVSRITAVLALLVLVLGIAFVFIREDMPGLGVGYSLFLFMLGAPAVGAGAWLLGKASTAMPVVAPAPAGAGIPACPRCKSPTEWVPDHARFMCRGCSIYV
jgi:hypothetical protein